METKHLVEASCIWMSNDLYESLPDAYKEVVDRAADEVSAEIEENCIAAEEEYKQMLVDNGYEVIECDTSGMIERAQAAWEEFFETTWIGFTLEEVREAAGIE